MSQPKTLLELAGAALRPAPLGESILIMVDCQNTYLNAPLRLAGIDAAMNEAARLLERARAAGAPVIHIAHDGGPGSLYDVRTDVGRIAEAVAPRDGEPTVVKSRPNAFAGTDLDERLRGLGARPLVFAGFMTHMCINSSVRAAFDLGYASTVVGDATATRDLPGPDGRTVKADDVQRASLSALADLFAAVVATADDLPA